MLFVECPYCHRDLCFNWDDIEEFCQDGTLAKYIFTEEEVTLICPHCRGEIRFIGKGRDVLLDKDAEAIALERFMRFEIRGAYALQVENRDGEITAFPTEDMVAISFVYGEFGNLDDLPAEWLDEVQKNGANIIVIDHGDRNLTLYYM